MSTWISSQGEQDRSGVALDNERGINVGEEIEKDKKKTNKWKGKRQVEGKSRVKSDTEKNERKIGILQKTSRKEMIYGKRQTKCQRNVLKKNPSL